MRTERMIFRISVVVCLLCLIVMLAPIPALADAVSIGTFTYIPNYDGQGSSGFIVTDLTGTGLCTPPPVEPIFEGSYPVCPTSLGFVNPILAITGVYNALAGPLQNGMVAAYTVNPQTTFTTAQNGQGVYGFDFDQSDSANTFLVPADITVQFAAFVNNFSDPNSGVSPSIFYIWTGIDPSNGYAIDSQYLSDGSFTGALDLLDTCGSPCTTQQTTDIFTNGDTTGMMIETPEPLPLVLLLSSLGLLLLLRKTGLLQRAW